MIFNLGAVIGSLIPLAQNINNTVTGTVTDGTYIGFIVLMFLGALLAWSLVDARHVQRNDGSHVILMKYPTWQSEIYGLWEVLLSDPYIVLLFPMFFSSNWFYTYQFQDVNLAQFNLRARALNNTLYWTSQILGAYIFGYGLDIKGVRRSTKAKAVLAVLFALTMIVWGGGYAFQKGYARPADDVSPEVLEAHKLDWTESAYIGPMFLYMFYGFYDAAWQTCIYWYMGSLTNNSRKLANFTGFYKGIQSAGAAIISRVDALKAPYMNNFAASWTLLAGSLVIAAPVIFTKIRDFVPVEDDLKFSDETIEDVVPPGTEAAEVIR